MDRSTQNVANSLVRLNGVLFDDGDFFYSQGKRLTDAIQAGGVGRHFRAIRERCERKRSSKDTIERDKEEDSTKISDSMEHIANILVRAKDHMKSSHILANESLKGGAIATRQRDLREKNVKVRHAETTAKRTGDDAIAGS